MKRLVWLVLAVFCTALAQVQPVDLPVTKAKVCDCCKVAGTCGMPGCCPPPAHVPTGFSSVQPARIAVLSVKRKAKPVRRAAEKFYAPFVEPVTLPVTLPVSALAAPAAGVPLFKAHCSFLI